MLYWASCTLQTNTLEQRETERHSGKKKIKIKGKKQKYRQGGSVFFKHDKKIPEREENPGGFVVLCALCGKYQGLYIYKYSFYQQNKYFCSSPKFLRLNHKVAMSLLFLRVIFEVALYKSSTYRFFKTYFLKK